jgi:trehalose 6-phosphate synthase
VADQWDEENQGAVVLVSNRGPIQFGRSDGERTSERGGGGLVTALSGVAGRLDDAVWVCGALTEEDAVVAREQRGKAFEPEGVEPPGLKVRMVEMDPEARQKYYAVVANPILWFIHHYLWSLADEPDFTRRELDAYDTGYVPINEDFANVVAEEVEARGGHATVMVQDYHFYLLPERVRSRCPDVFLQHFIHIPWPQSDWWRVLPPRLREELLVGLLGNDVVAFHLEQYARNFVQNCHDVLGLDVDVDRLTVDLGDRRVLARWYPISVDAAQFEKLAQSEGVREWEGHLASQRREHLVLRVDRGDPSKNILRGFRAFDVLLDDHPELRERVTFLALVQPSREDVEQYADYLERIRRLVADINLKHGTADWQPIDLHMEGNFDLVVAAYKSFDVLVVNSVFDGMNLVAKESIIVNERDGVLLLSENTGSHDELGRFALTLHPFDIQQQADMIYEALHMAPEERRDRREACDHVVRQNDVTKWLNRQLRDVRRIREGEIPEKAE